MVDCIDFLKDDMVKELMETYLKESHSDFFEDEKIVEKKIPEFKFIK
jgi:hypothetical protein